MYTKTLAKEFMTQNVHSNTTSVNNKFSQNAGNLDNSYTNRLNVALTYCYQNRKNLFFEQATPKQRCILELVLHHTDPNTGIIYITQAGIAEQIGCNRKTVLRAFTFFEKAKVIERGKQTKVNKNGYWGFCQNRLIFETLSVGHLMSHKEPKGSIYNKSNYSINENSSKSFEVENYKPTGSAKRFFDKEVSLMVADEYLADIRLAAKHRQSTLNRPITESEVNYLSYFVIKRRKLLVWKYGDRYIPLAKRLKFKEKKLNIPTGSATQGERFDIPDLPSVSGTPPSFVQEYQKRFEPNPSNHDWSIDDPEIQQLIKRVMQ